MRGATIAGATIAGATREAWERAAPECPAVGGIRVVAEHKSREGLPNSDLRYGCSMPIVEPGDTKARRMPQIVPKDADAVRAPFA